MRILMLILLTSFLFCTSQCRHHGGDGMHSPEPYGMSSDEPMASEYDKPDKSSKTKGGPKPYKKSMIPFTPSEFCPVKAIPGAFSYDEEMGDGPSKWGRLSPENARCADGRLQSPIDFQTDIRISGKRCGAKVHLKDGMMKYKPTSSNWMFRCADLGGCGWITFLNRQYMMDNIHFHKPSEHHMNGVRYPLEANLEFHDDFGHVIVVAVLFQYERESSFLQQTASRMMLDNNKHPLVESLLNAVELDEPMSMVNMSNFVHESKGFCSYMGSLTVPPCTEGVIYLMSMHTPTVSRRQVHKFWVSTGFSFDGNARPLKPLNEREVTCYIG